MIENLKMSYTEIMNTEYCLLLMMQHDKPRVDYPDKKDEVKNISGKDMLARKRIRL
jgi:hypothetical protein